MTRPDSFGEFEATSLSFASETSQKAQEDRFFLITSIGVNSRMRLLRWI
jgi:hypothetical protein